MTDNSQCPHCNTPTTSGSRYCPQCGNALPQRSCRMCNSSMDTDDRYCQYCGAEQGKLDPESRHKRFRRHIRRKVAKGWEIEHDWEDEVILVNRDIGNLFIHAALIPLTGGLGNLLYAYYRHTVKANRVFLSVEDYHPKPSGVSPQQSDVDTQEIDTEVGQRSANNELQVSGNYSGYIASIVLMTIGFAGLFTGEAPVMLVGFLVLLFGAGVFPSITERIARRYSLTANGTIRSVDKTTFEGETHRCMACGNEVAYGTERTYREEFVVGGIPLHTYTDGTNHYCPECAEHEHGTSSHPYSNQRTRDQSVESDGSR